MKRLPLHEFHVSHEARWAEINHWILPAHYGDPAVEIERAKNSVVLLDRSYLGKVKLSGPDTIDFLNHTSTNDMHCLFAQTVCDTVFSTPQGKIVDYCRTLHLIPDVLLVSSFMDSKHILSWLERLQLTETVDIADASEGFLWLTLIGPQSISLIESCSGHAISIKDDTVWLKNGESEFPALRNDNFMVPAYNLCLPTENSTSLVDWIVEEMNQFNGVLIGEEAFQIIRVESGMPDWGTELTEEYNPHEARLLNAVSFTKGAYTGQEVIARLDTYGTVQKYLMIVDIFGQLDEPPPVKIAYNHQIIGTLTSYAFDPISQQHVGLGYVDRTYTVDGLNLKVDILTRNYSIPARLRIPPSASI